VDAYTDWFFSKMNKTLVPTYEYMQKLENKGFSKINIDYFRRGIETDIFKPHFNAKEETFFRLLYVGRISKDKNIDFLIEFFEKLQKRIKDVKLEIVGDGPYFKSLYKKVKRNKDIILKGKIDYKDLPEIYNSADLLVFPSVTDTFGMVVLEAQACGVPAIVSNIGGPQEIVKDGETGFVAPVNNDNWIQITANIIEMKRNNDIEYLKLKTASRNRVLANYDLNKILKELLDRKVSTQEKEGRIRESDSTKSILSA
jgi:glycosyltransferase involved in cell wall biosynthesis